MIHEIAHILVKPGHQQAFETGVNDAKPLFLRARGCHSLALHRCIEEPLRYTLVVQWATLEDHMVHFRQSDDFHAWRALVGDHFDGAPVVHHEAQVL